MKRSGCLFVVVPALLTLSPVWAEDSLSVILGGKTPSLMNSLNLIAEGAGFYKEESLKVTTTLVNGSLAAQQTCSSGKGDICPIGIEPVITRREAGGDIKMFLSRMSKFGYVLAVPEDSPIRKPEDFRGRKIGVHVVTGPSPVFATQSALSLAGLKPSDYTFVTVGMEGQAAGALTSGKVEAVALPFYELIPIMVGGTKLRVFRHPGLLDVPNSGYAAAPSVLLAKRDQIRRFSRAIVKASLLIRYNPAAAARILLTTADEPATAEDVRRKTAELNAWQSDLPAADPASMRIGAIAVDGARRYIQLIADAGLTKTAVPASDVVTEEFIGFANDFDRVAFEKLARSMR